MRLMPYQRGEARVLPVIRALFISCKGTPFGKFQVLPTDAKPIMQTIPERGQKGHLFLAPVLEWSLLGELVVPQQIGNTVL